MFKNILSFIKYNNLTVLILAAILILGTGAFAQTEAGQAVIGEKQTSTEGVDNTLLIEAELDGLDMDFKIERIEENDDYYFVVYTYLDLVKTGGITPPSIPPPGGTNSGAWEYQIQEKTRKITKNNERYEDLGEFLAEELKEQYEARIKELKREQEKAQETGEEVREEVVAYDGLIGQTLNIAGRVFPGYEPVKARVIPSPSIPPTVLQMREQAEVAGVADNLTNVYNDYIAENDPDGDEVFGVLDNCPDVFNPEQLDEDEDGVGDVCDSLDNPSTSSGQAEQITDNSKATSTEEVMEETATSSEEVVEEPVATSTPEENTEEPEVEIIELSEDEETATST